MAKKRLAKKTGPAARSKSARRRLPVRAKATKPAPRKRTATKPARPKTTRPAAATNPVRELAERIVDLTVHHQDEQAFAFYADNVQSIEPGMPPVTGIEAIRQKFAMWRGMVSDSSWEARHVWVEGNTIAIEWAGRVTFAATGKQAEFNEIAVHEIDEGKIVRERFYYDPSVLQP